MRPGDSDNSSYFEDARRQMLDDIARHAYESSSYTGFSVFSDKVKRAMACVAREEFVPKDSAEYAYKDKAMSIGYGQTISQPFIVALMCEVLELDGSPGSRVLDVGAGCGYHAAVLSKLAQKVFSVEIVPELALIAQKNLQAYSNVTVSQRNGRLGWPEYSPYDAISVAAASKVIPNALVNQLKTGGKMIIPLGNSKGLSGVFDSAQSLTLVTKTETGVRTKAILPVIFVPFIE